MLKADFHNFSKQLRRFWDSMKQTNEEKQDFSTYISGCSRKVRVLCYVNRHNIRSSATTATNDLYTPNMTQYVVTFLS
jgi:hypothetical protein